MQNFTSLTLVQKSPIETQKSSYFVRNTHKYFLENRRLSMLTIGTSNILTYYVRESDVYYVIYTIYSDRTV